MEHFYGWEPGAWRVVLRQYAAGQSPGEGMSGPFDSETAALEAAESELRRKIEPMRIARAKLHKRISYTRRRDGVRHG